VRSDLLAELSDLFVIESFVAAKRDDEEESERLWEIALELSTRRKEALMRELEEL
jgi:hypothetical protein